MCIHKNHVLPNGSTTLPIPFYNIFVVEDNPLMRQGYRMLIDVEPDLFLCGEATNGLEALEMMLNSGPPDLVITDISMKRMDGLELTKYLHELWPKLPILVSSTYEKYRYAQAAREAGAGGYVQKCDLVDDGIGAIRCLLGVNPCKGCSNLFLRS